MSHYAKVVNGIVTQVIAADPSFFNTFVDTSPGTWIQTSYNTRGGVHYAPNSNTPDEGTPLRGNYAGIGYAYDSTNDVFYPPQPYPSWIIIAPNWTWTAPTPYPSDGNQYTWDETTKSWVEVPTAASTTTTTPSTSTTPTS
jgi:hypothetical protein